MPKGRPWRGTHGVCRASRWFPLAATLACLLASAAAQPPNIQVTAIVSPQRLRPGDTFRLMLQVVQWSQGTTAPAEPTISWPDWQGLGIARAETLASQTTNIPAGDRTMGSMSVTLALQAKAEGTITIPPIMVRGVTGTATTAPLTVVVDAKAAAPAPTAPTPHPAPAAPLTPPPMPRLSYLMSQADLRPFYSEVGVQLRLQLSRVLALDLSAQPTDQVVAAARQRLRDDGLIQAIAECAQFADDVVVGATLASQPDVARHMHLLRYLAAMVRV